MKTTSPKNIRIFLSYARGDDEAFVRRLYADLTSHGFDVWCDREKMPSRALSFLKEIQLAIDASDRLVLVVGPEAVSSDYVIAEWRYALEIGKAINPVLRLADRDVLPEELRLVDTPDFRDDGNYAPRLQTLVRQLSEPVAPMGRLVNVPSLPPHYLQPADQLRAIKETVLADLRRPVVVTGTVARMGIHGMGGIGKSVLAAALARDHEVRRAFPDGVVWVPVGQEPQLVTLQRGVVEALDAPGHFNSVFEGKGRLSELLADRGVLLILDDLWKANHAEAFDVLGSRCRVVVTTRDASLITVLGGTQYEVGLLAEPEALALLADWSGCAVESLPAVAHDAMAECGRLPLALAICGAMVRDGTSWNAVLIALRNAELEYLDHPHGNVLKSIKVSVDSLATNEARRFAELAVFPPDESVPEDAILTLWSYTGAMEEHHAHKLLTVLERRALIRLDIEAPEAGQTPKRRVGLHDLHYDYVCRIAGEQAALHDQLLEAYRRKCPDGWHSGPKDGYFLQHLHRHFAEAGQVEQLVQLLLDLNWLEAKVENGLVFDLVSEFTQAQEHEDVADPQRRILRLLEEALRRDSHFIARHAHEYPQGLFQCLWNTCWWYDCPEAAQHYLPSPACGAGDEGVSPGGAAHRAPWQYPEDQKLSRLLERWRRAKGQASPGFRWLSSRRPPPTAVLTMAEHQEGLLGVVFSDRHVVSVSQFGTVKLWDPATGKVQTMPTTEHNDLTDDDLDDMFGDHDPVWPLAVLWDGRVLSGRMDGSVKVWDHETGVVQDVGKHSHPISGLAVLPNGWIASADVDGEVNVWDPATGPIAGYYASIGGAWAPGTFPDGRVVWGGGDGEVVVWSPSSLRMSTMKQHTDAIWAVAVLPSSRVVSGSADHLVKIWNVRSGKVRTMDEHTGRVLTVAVLSDGRVVSGSDDAKVKLWNPKTGHVQTMNDHSAPVWCVTTLLGKRVVSGSADGTVKVWDPATGEVETMSLHAATVWSVATSPDGLVASVGSDMTVKLWDPSARECSERRGHNRSVEAVAALTDGRVASASWDKTVKLWEPATGDVVTMAEHAATVRSLAVLPDGRLASGDDAGTIKLWDPATGRVLTMRERIGYVWSLASTRDCRVVSGSDRIVTVWDPLSGHVQKMHGHTDFVMCVAVLPDGRVVSGSSNGIVILWDPSSGCNLVMDEQHDGAVRSLAVLPDGRVVSGSDDATVRLWDLATGRVLAVWDHTEEVLSVVASDDRVVWGGFDGTVRLWDPPSGHVMTMPERARGLTYVAILPDGRVVSGSDHIVRVWNPITSELAFFGTEGQVTSVACALYRPRIAAGLRNGGVLILDVEPESSQIQSKKDTTRLRGRRKKD